MKENEVCEDFLGFVQIEKMDAQTIADKIISSVTSWGLNIDNLVGQGYGGAATMSSSKMVLNQKLGTIIKMQHMFTAVHTFWPWLWQLVVL